MPRDGNCARPDPGGALEDDKSGSHVPGKMPAKTDSSCFMTRSEMGWSGLRPQQKDFHSGGGDLFAPKMGKVWGVGHLQGRSVVMIAKCANPVCSTAFHYLREGKIFRMECDPSGSPLKPKLAGSKPVRKIEHFWLCGPCSATLTLVMNEGKVETVAIEPAVLTRAVAS